MSLLEVHLWPQRRFILVLVMASVGAGEPFGRACLATSKLRVVWVVAIVVVEPFRCACLAKAMEFACLSGGLHGPCFPL